MWQSARPIETAPHNTDQDRPFLLWCPEQGGWQTGMWFNGRWMDSITLSHPLAPTYWTEIPPANADFAKHVRDRDQTAWTEQLGITAT